MSHRAPALAFLMLAIGLTVVTVGIATHSHTIRTGGLVTTVLGATAVVVTQQRKATHATADQLADADRAGYIRGLDHAARGLMDTPPPTGHPHTAPTTATIHQLHSNTEHRKAE